MKKILLLLCCLNFLTLVKAQQLVQERLYKIGNSNKGLVASSLTREGNVVITGSYTFNPGYQSIFTLVKPNTDTLWMRLGPLIALGGIGIKQTINSGYVVYTTKVNTSPTTSGTALLKYDGNGMLKQVIPYAINTFDSGHLILLAPDSGYYLGGNNIIAGKNNRFTLGRTDSLGNLKWRKGYAWSNGDFLADMQHTLNGNIIMYGITGASQRLKLLLVNQQGDSVLGRILSIIGSNRVERVSSAISSVTPLLDGGFLLAAEIDTTVTGGPSKLGMVVKVNASLQPVWHYINRSVTDNVFFTRSRELTDGSMVVLGFERKGTGSMPGDKFFLYRFNPTGSLLNIYTFTSTIATQVQTTTLEALPDSSFIIGGNGVVTPAPNLSAGFYVAKVKIAGLAPALPLPGPIKVTGTKEDAFLAGTTLGQSYPNPTAAEAIISYSLPKNYTKARIMIREIATGREIKDFELKRNTSSLTVDLSGLSNGLYLYSLVVDDKPVATKKLAVIK
ncbi:T9SS type A sorting domain-containing protein [Adhaeribacter sp. BT258]|uniref:T9SS type A sorting domain-containing protein n=1 Tax=Adhaeribacter terrigena TaxID=2793070 RepID=A0ABS1BYJ1_9BACT|nr:T9SS type A sorting domain-containing protein [Adhaeribacter terrigena]MBK0402238.1 T9SS type A sorting domain-containing protein [Adhaeribacter terrigena]